jgi:hypothetical protein
MCGFFGRVPVTQYSEAKSVQAAGEPLVNASERVRVALANAVDQCRQLGIRAGDCVAARGAYF